MREYCGNSSGCTVNSTHYAAGAVIQTVTVPTADGDPRGIMIDSAASPSIVYVTTSSYGATGSGVYDFTINASTGVAGSLATYQKLTASTTSGGNETGQLRGITYDPGGNILYADSTWGPTSGQGYIDENKGTATGLTALNGPNALEVGEGTASSGVLSSSCDVLWVAGYYSGNLGESNTGYNTSGALSSTCEGSGVLTVANSTVFISGLTDLSGFALSVGEDGLGDDTIAGPTGLFLVPDSPLVTPEPGTFALMIGALLLALGIGIRAQRRQLQ